MVGFIFHNPEASIKLFQKDHPHQLVRKGHGRKAESVISSLQYRRRKSERTAYQKNEMAYSAYAKPLDFPGKLHRIQHLSVDGKSNHISAVILQSF